MKTPTKKSERIAGVILVGLLFGTLVVAVLWYWQHKIQESKLMPIEEAMYVTDWEIMEIFGPGTPQQEHIVEKFRSMGSAELEFDSPVLYRMGGRAEHTSEGILLMGFDPTHPEMAKQLKVAP